MAELNELFEEIFHSERKYEARADYLKKLNANIEETTTSIQKTKEELQTKKGELAVKNNKLVSLEMEVTLFRVRKTTFEAQRQELSKEKARLSNSHETMLREYLSEKESFNKSLREFCCCHDLTGSGLRYREELEKKQLSSLQEELVLLETELLEIESYMEDMKKLKAELESIEKLLESDKMAGEVLKTREIEQILLIGHLEKGEDLKDEQQSASSELKSLQAELEACKTSKEEETCKKLRKDLEDLQEEYYRKQMKLQVQRQSGVQNASLALLLGRNERHRPFIGQEPAAEVKEIFEIDSQSDTEDEIWNNIVENDKELGSDEEIGSYARLEDNFNNLQSYKAIQTGVATDALISSSENYDFKKSQSKRACRSCHEEMSTNPVKKLKFSGNTSSSAKSQIKWPYQTVESPDPNVILRKRPGQSIYKAPGSNNDATIYQGKKKVHFQY